MEKYGIFYIFWERIGNIEFWSGKEWEYLIKPTEHGIFEV